MTDFWNKNKTPAPKAWEQPAPPEVVLDEAAVEEITSESPTDVFEEDEQDNFSLMSDANLRLEQGRLYQMVLANDIFGETDADPKAIRNVQREIRKFVRERMEIMLGIKQEQVAQPTMVSSPFNDMEVTVLKMLASKATGGKTEEIVRPVVPAPSQPKKDGITAISGNLRANSAPTPVSKPVRQLPPAQKAKEKPKSAISNDEGSALKKPIEEMTPEELAAYNAAAEERSKRHRSATPPNLIPHPSPEQLTMMYTMQANDRMQQLSNKMTPKN